MMFHTRLLALLSLVTSAAPVLAQERHALPPDLAALVDRAGNVDDDRARQKLLEQLAASTALDEVTRREAKTLVEFVRNWNDGGLKFYSGKDRGKPEIAVLEYDFEIAKDSPLFPLTAICQGRIIAWNLIENSTVRTSVKLAPKFKDEAVEAIRKVRAAYPQNQVARMYLDEAQP